MVYPIANKYCTTKNEDVAPAKWPETPPYSYQEQRYNVEHNIYDEEFLPISSAKKT